MTDRQASPKWWLALTCCLAFAACSPPVAPPAESGPGFELSFGNQASHTVIPGQVLTVDLLVQRDEGFEGLINLEASDTPGIVLVFRPAEILSRPSSHLQIVADPTTQRRTHQIEIRGSSAGRETRTAVLSLTVVDSK
jgi:hypothetical protein